MKRVSTEGGKKHEFLVKADGSKPRLIMTDLTDPSNRYCSGSPYRAYTAWPQAAPGTSTASDDLLERAFLTRWSTADSGHESIPLRHCKPAPSTCFADLPAGVFTVRRLGPGFAPAEKAGIP